jgi:hypothetical protein
MLQHHALLQSKVKVAMALPYWCGKVRGKVIEVESKRNMTGRSLECALSNLLLAVAYHTIVSLGAKTNYLAYISKHNSTSILFINEIFFLIKT